MNIHLIGLGGTGSFLLEPLVKLLTYHPKVDDFKLYCWDADKVEKHNISRQYNPEDVNTFKGLNKIKNLESISSNIELLIEYCDKEYLLYYLNKSEDNIVIATVDNFASRKAFIEAIYETNNNTLFISPGNDYSNGQCYSFYYSNKTLKGFDCLVLPEWNNPQDNIPIAGGCVLESISSPQLMSANLMSALSVLNNLNCVFDKGYFYSQSYFDVFSNKLISSDLVYLD